MSFLVFSGLLAACANDPSGAWVGRYQVDVEETDFPCDGSASQTFNDVATWTIVHDSSGTFVNGTCRLPLVIHTADEAMFGVTTCRLVAPDGALMDIGVTGGVLHRDAFGWHGRLQGSAHEVGGPRCLTTDATLTATQL